MAKIDKNVQEIIKKIDNAPYPKKGLMFYIPKHIIKKIKKHIKENKYGGV